MAEEVKKVKEEDEKKVGPLGKLKAALVPDAEEQAAIIGTMVRITVLAWSGAILTLNYVSIPGVPQQKIDPTFIASVFTGVLASFGIQTASKKGDGTMKMNGNGNGANGNGVGPGGGPIQTLRIEQAPLKIIAVDPSKTKKEEPFKM